MKNNLNFSNLFCFLNINKKHLFKTFMNSNILIYIHIHVIIYLSISEEELNVVIIIAYQY
jgi:hypothetical protein